MRMYTGGDLPSGFVCFFTLVKFTNINDILTLLNVSIERSDLNEEMEIDTTNVFSIDICLFNRPRLVIKQYMVAGIFSDSIWWFNHVEMDGYKDAGKIR